jgi:hypothetical protein
VRDSSLGRGQCELLVTRTLLGNGHTSSVGIQVSTAFLKSRNVSAGQAILLTVTGPGRFIYIKQHAVVK